VGYVLLYIAVSQLARLMKQLLMLSFLFMPVAAWAQDKIAPLTPPLQMPLPIEQALRGSLNPHGLQLAVKTVLYRHPSDTTSGKVARRLLPGDAVIIRSKSARWLKVIRGTRDCMNFSADTATYYMPQSGTLGARTFVLL
jgi:hypothetical protein